MVALTADWIGVAGLLHGSAAVGAATGSACKNDADATHCDRQASHNHDGTTQEAPDDSQHAACEEGRPRTAGYDEKDSAYAERCS
jgi:hypothetical protein